MIASKTIEHAAGVSAVQTIQIMQTTAVGVCKVVATTVNAICKQLEQCESIHDLEDVIERLRASSR